MASTSSKSSTFAMIRDRLADLQRIYQNSTTEAQREQVLAQLKIALASAKNGLTGAKTGRADDSIAYQITDQALKIAQNVFARIKTNPDLKNVPIVQEAIQVARLGCSEIGNACFATASQTPEMRGAMQTAYDSFRTAGNSITSTSAPLQAIQSKFNVETAGKARDALVAAQLDFDRAKTAFRALSEKMVGGDPTLKEVFQEIEKKTTILRELIEDKVPF